MARLLSNTRADITSLRRRSCGIMSSGGARMQVSSKPEELHDQVMDLSRPVRGKMPASLSRVIGWAQSLIVGIATFSTP